MGRKVIPLMLAYLLGALTAIGVFEVRIWQHWSGEAQAEIAAHDVETLAAVRAGQAHAQMVARAKANARPSTLKAPTFALPTRETMQPHR
jgi:hypothetical protein